jgi:hypothetical protein
VEGVNGEASLTEWGGYTMKVVVGWG